MVENSIATPMGTLTLVSSQVSQNVLELDLKWLHAKKISR